MRPSASSIPALARVLGCVLGLTWTATHAQVAPSGQCDLTPVCGPGAPCESATLSLSWTVDGGAAMMLDDTPVALSVVETTEPQTIRVGQTIYRITGPDRRLLLSEGGRPVGTVLAGSDPATVTVTLGMRPRRYTEYPNAIAASRTYSGPCEGLF